MNYEETKDCFREWLFGGKYEREMVTVLFDKVRRSMLLTSPEKELVFTILADLEREHEPNYSATAYEVLAILEKYEPLSSIRAELLAEALAPQDSSRAA